MKLRHLCTILTLAAIAVIANGCKDAEKNNKINTIVEVQLGQLIKTMANNEEDSALNRAIMAADNNRVGNRAAYVQLFAAAYAAQHPDATLGQLFKNKYEYATMVTASDAEITKRLQDSSNAAMKRITTVLEQRLSTCGVKNVIIKANNNRGLLKIEGEGNIDSAQLATLLTLTGSVEIYEAYSSEEILPSLLKINDSLAAIAGYKEEKKNEQESDTGHLMPTPAQMLKTEENTRRKNPLFSVLGPAVDEAGLPQQAPIAGSFLKKDTDKWHKLLYTPMARRILPKDAYIMLGSTTDSSPFYNMYVAKMPENGTPYINNERIVNAEATKNELTERYEVTVTFDNIGKKLFFGLTGTNVNRYIIVAIDGKVNIAPKVMGAIPDGQVSVITKLTQAEATNMAAAIKCGKLPAPVKVVKNNVTSIE